MEIRELHQSRIAAAQPFERSGCQYLAEPTARCKPDKKRDAEELIGDKWPTYFTPTTTIRILQPKLRF